MTGDLLAELGLIADGVLHLTGQTRIRLLNFLLRWHATGELHCVSRHLLEGRPDMVSLLDLEARALAADGRYDEALQTMEDRLRLRSSVTAQGLLADIYLAKGDVGTAEAIGQSLIDEDDESYTGWRLKAEAALARSDLEAAAVANHRLGELRPNGTRYLLDMMEFYQARAGLGDGERLRRAPAQHRGDARSAAADLPGEAARLFQSQWRGDPRRRDRRGTGRALRDGARRA